MSDPSTDTLLHAACVPSNATSLYPKANELRFATLAAKKPDRRRHQAIATQPRVQTEAARLPIARSESVGAGYAQVQGADRAAVPRSHRLQYSDRVPWIAPRAVPRPASLGPIVPCFLTALGASEHTFDILKQARQRKEDDSEVDTDGSPEVHSHSDASAGSDSD